MSIKIENRIQIFFLVVFSVVAVGVQLSSITDDQMNMYKALAGLVCLMSYMLFSRNRNIFKKSIGYGIVASVLMLISIFYNGNAREINLLWVWSYLGVALILYQYCIPKNIALFLFYVCSLSFCVVALKGDLQSNEVLEHGSANHVSILCIYCMFLYYISFRNKRNELLPYIPIVIVAFLSLWTANRSGIISCAIFFVAILFFNNKISQKSHSRFRNYVVIAVVAVLLVYFFLNYYAQFDVAMESKMDRQGMQSARSFIWADYTRGVFDSIGNMFFGVPGDSDAYPFLKFYSGNPHNSFLVVHSKFGLVGFLVILYVLVKTVWISVKRKDWVILSLLLLVVTRSFFDWTAFPGLYDVMFWYFIFYVSDNKSTPNNHILKTNKI